MIIYFSILLHLQHRELTKKLRWLNLLNQIFLIKLKAETK